MAAFIVGGSSDQSQALQSDARHLTHGMRRKITDRNPTSLVRQSAKRERVPDVLTAEEIGIFGGQFG